MKKKLFALLLAGSMVLLLAACKGSSKEEGDITEEISLNVTTTFAGDDGNAQNYKKAIAEFEENEGIKVNDASTTSDESFKARIETDFQTGSEPDVLFFFIGADANSFIGQGKVVSIETIREEYPDYATNMNEDLITSSLVDGKKYAVPVNGYWEGLFCNTAVLKSVGVEKPGADYTWAQFLADCEKIKEGGFIPIAASLGDIPHYWWEYSVFNHTSTETHLEIPISTDEGNGPGWVQGINDIKALYEKGYFPENTLSAKDDETFAMFTSGQAAYLIDGSWKVGSIASACQSDPDDPATLNTEKLENFTVTYVPTNGNRKATDLIGGLSMGYYISAKAWENESKRDAAVKFVIYMTSEEKVSLFAQHTVSALKNAPDVHVENFNSLQIKSINMMAGVTSLTGAVQDIFSGECRIPTFDGMPQLVTGEVPVKEAVQDGFDIYLEQSAGNIVGRLRRRR